MEPLIKEIEFTSLPSNKNLRGRFVLPTQSNKRFPVVIMLTGDGPKGSKSLSWANLPPRLCEKGIASFLFDFEGLGYSDGDRAKLTLSKGIENFKSAFHFLLKQSIIEPNRIGIMASSFGATVALLQPELVNRVKLLGLKSPACFLADAYVNECGEELLTEWLDTGYSNILGYDKIVLIDSLKHNAYESAEAIKTKTFITHGNKDEIVPYRQSVYLSHLLKGEKELTVFEGVSHNYSEEGAWERMANLFVEWFSNNL